ncbi:BAG4 regulator, partial [Bucco capensis]|nr:BAG4 regulator [Bucco capensis]
QVMESPYANGAYSPPYPSHYSSLPQAQSYYCSGPPQTPYPSESRGIYQPQSPAPPWGYTSPECPPEGSSLQRQQVPGYSPPQTPGMPIPQYPYGDSNPGLTAQGPPPQPRAPEDSWPAPSYGVQPRYGWSPAPGNPFISESHPAWAGSGAPAQPPAWDPKDIAYDNPEQSAKQHNYSCDAKQQQPGPVSEARPARARAKAKVQYSAQPQLYDTAPSHKLQARPREAPSNPAAMQPEIQRILQVLGEAEQLEQEVDEFVGRKTEKAYRLLEELLTKLLLELDCVETGGQQSVRQARKESVHRVQAILEKLERKGL